MAVTEYSFEIVDTLDLTGLSSVSAAGTLTHAVTYAEQGIVVAGEGSSGSSSLILDMDGDLLAQAGGMTGTAPATAIPAAGRFVTAVDAGDDIVFEVRDNSGQLIVPLTFVGESTEVSDVDVEAIGGGSFALVYQMRFSETDNDIRISIRAADGGELKTFSVDATDANDQAPTIARTSGGDFVVAWQRAVGNETQLWYALYDDEGVVQKGPTLLDATGTINRNACAISLNNGLFAIAYEDNGWMPSAGDTDITLKTFQSNGDVFDTTNVSLNDVDDTAPSLAVLRNGMLVLGSTIEGAAGSDVSWSLISTFDGTVLASQQTASAADESGVVMARVGDGSFAALFNEAAAGAASGKIVEAVRTTTGDDSDEIFFGDSLIDIVHAGGGADQIGSGGNVDRLFGQGGDDRFILYGNPSAGTVIHGGAGIDTVAVQGIANFRGVQFASIEKLRIEGSSVAAVEYPAAAILTAAQVGDQLSHNLAVTAISEAAETLKVILGTAASVDLSGFTFEGFDGQKDGVVIIGGNQANTILGSVIADSISGGGGKDLLRGGGGIDLIRGGAGDDIFIVDAAGEAREAANQGRDTVRSSVDYTLSANLERLQLLGGGDLDGKGNALNNELYGNGGANLLSGGLGRDLLNGRGGVDDLRGGAGNDVYLANAAGEAREKAGEGVDTVRASVSYTLGANLERLQLLGGGDLDGKGNAIANRLTGNGGDNVLNGAGGNDRMAGGGGEDGFLFNSALGAGNVDLILDFDTADDSIRLDDAIFAGLTNAGRAAAFHIGKTAADASDRIIYNSETGALFFDADGKGGAAQIRFATLDTGLELTAADIVIV